VRLPAFFTAVLLALLACGPDDRAEERWKELEPEEKEQITKAYERIRELPREERRRRERLFEEHMRGRDPAERKELLEKLRRIRDLPEPTRKKLERHTRKLRHFRQAWRAELPPEARERLEALDPQRRRMLDGFVMGRSMESFRRRLREGLSEEERERLSRLKGRERGRTLMRILQRRLADRLSPEERRELEALPAAERRGRYGRMMREAHAGLLDAARAEAVEEAARILAGPPDALDRMFRRHRVHHELRRLRVADRALLATLADLPPPELEGSLERLRRLLRETDDAEDRRAALERFKASLRGD